MNRVLLAVSIGVALLTSVSGCHHGVAATEELAPVKVSDWSVPSAAQSGSPLQVTLEVQSGGCIRFKRVEVLRTEAQVTIRVWGTTTAPITGVGAMLMCPRTFPQTEVMQLDPPFLQSFTIVVEEPDAWPNLSAVVTV